jgi:N-methylhydantoinase B
MNTPIEVVESEYPLMVEELALRPGSGGDGCHRGGLGFRRAYRILGADVTLTTMIERRIVPPYGLFGGRDAAPFRITLNPGTSGERDIKGKETMKLAQGDLVLLESCGGGGYGDPSQRPAAAREADRREGYVT